MPDPNQQVQPADARTFVQAFVPDPKMLEGMDDTSVVAYHGRVTEALDKVRPANGKWPDAWRQELVMQQCAGRGAQHRERRWRCAAAVSDGHHI